jgi:superfamily II DNA helicase RecQ
VLAREARKRRNSLRDDYTQLLADANVDLDEYTTERDDALARFNDLKAWRAEVAREHNLPAYVIFHDATLASIAHRAPQSIEDLQGISGMGVKKLEAYASEVLRVVRASG